MNKLLITDYKENDVDLWLVKTQTLCSGSMLVKVISFRQDSECFFFFKNEQIACYFCWQVHVSYETQD